MENRFQFLVIMTRKKRKRVFGFGINDYQEMVTDNRIGLKFYTTWKDMIRRCYYGGYLKRFPSYQGCKVCEEWKYLSNFKNWYDEHYVEGWHLDKDLLIKGNKEYSPKTCCFIPLEINSFLTYKKSSGGNLPVGVFHKGGGVYMAKVKYKNRQIYLGRSNDPEELLSRYKKEKEREAKELAEEYKDLLDPRAYEALMNFQIDIKD